MTRSVGVLGCGHLAEYLVRGLAGTPHAFVLSPRGAETAARLAAVAPARIAADNQAVVDAADLVLVCLPAATGLAELARLRFRPGQKVLSCMAGTRIGPLAQAVAPAMAAVAMMPGLANAHGVGPSVLFPADPDWQALLGRLGPVHVLPDPAAFDRAAVMGALSGASIHLIGHLAGWFVAQGLDPALARALVADIFRGNAEVVARAPEGLDALAAGVTTPGGITEALLASLGRDHALTAWDRGLDLVRDRIAGA